MDTTMETMDIDIDLGDAIEETEILQAPVTETSQVIDASPAPQAPVDEAVPSKIHIRGLDDLSTANIEAFSLEFFPDQKPTIEWIDDTSANIVFEDSETAQKALVAFTSVAVGDASSVHQLQLREAKSPSSHPEARLQVRTATLTDRKKPRAHEASRYYLLHPEEDPRERRRKETRPRRRRKSDDEVETYDASMYDDDEGALAARRRRRDSGSMDDSDRPRRGRGRDFDRDRSASPSRGGSRSEYRRRSRDRARGGKDLFEDSSGSRNNRDKELFSSTVKSVHNRSAAGNLKKELFPLKSGSDADKAADLFSTKMSVPLVDGAAEDPGDGDFPLRSDVMYENQRKKEAQGFNIKGAAGTMDGDQGFSIRGSSGQKKSIKELFPEKVGPNAGKELFGRGRRRNKAADLFG